MTDFRALRLHQTDTASPDVKIERLTADDLSTGNVLIANEFSSLNYKDALAVTGKGKIIRHFPMIPGIDAAGVVLESDDPQFHAGEHVILTGHGVGETHTGGMSEQVRVPGSYLVKTPHALDSRQAMQFGTGGLRGCFASSRYWIRASNPLMGRSPSPEPVVAWEASPPLCCPL